MRTLSVLAFVGALLVLIVAIFFTGTRVKGPLSKYLSERSEMSVAIESAEFSPLYPNIIKLSNVSFGNSLIGEFYLEYELSSLWSDTFHINDIYINKLKLDPEDLKKIASSQFGYHKIAADAVRFHHTPLQTQYLQSQDATIRLHQVEFSQDEGLDFVSGVVSTEQAKFFHQDIKGLTVEFERLENGLELKHFNLAMLGGMVSGQGKYLQSSAHRSLEYNTTSASTESNADGADDAATNVSTDLLLSELNLSKIIIQDSIPTAPNVNLQADVVNLSDVIFSSGSNSSTSTTGTGTSTQSSAGQQSASAEGAAGAAKDNAEAEVVGNDFIMQGISGSLHNLKLNASSFSGSFKGNIDALALPQIQTTFEHNQGEATLSTDSVAFNFKGQLFSGSYAMEGSLDFAEYQLVLDHLALEKSKLAINPPRLEYLEHNLSDYGISLKAATFKDMEFLSFINTLPLSIQRISGQMENLELVAKPEQDAAQSYGAADPEVDGELFAQLHTLSSHLQPLKGHDAGLMQWQLSNTLYSNLLMQEIRGELEVTPESLTLSLPRVFFKESSLEAEASLERDLNEPSRITVQATDFESADLNSNLIDHMLTGKFSLDLALSSSRLAPSQADAVAVGSGAEAADAGAPRRVLNGSMALDSPNLLVSDFGLDLINGGHLQDFTLSGTELLSAIQGSVAGISDLALKASIHNDVAAASGTLSLATANMRATGSLDLATGTLSGHSELVSLARDSSTEVDLSGSMDAMSFKIHAISRGEERPGLYLPQYEASAVAKEQTDAAAVLKGLIQIEPEPEPEATHEAEPEDELSLIDQALKEQAAESAEATDAASTSTTKDTPESTEDTITAPAPQASATEETSSETDAAPIEPTTTEPASPEASAETAPASPEATQSTEEQVAPESDRPESNDSSSRETAPEPEEAIEPDEALNLASEGNEPEGEGSNSSSNETAPEPDENQSLVPDGDESAAPTGNPEAEPSEVPDVATEPDEAELEVSAGKLPEDEEQSEAGGPAAPEGSSAAQSHEGEAAAESAAPAVAGGEDKRPASAVVMPEQDKSARGDNSEQSAADAAAAEEAAKKLEDEASQFELNLLQDAFIDSFRNREDFDFKEDDDELIF